MKLCQLLMEKPAPILLLKKAEQMTPLVYRATMMGHIISKALNGPLNGRVIAVFNSSVYLEAERLLFCLGTRDMSPGPLNIVTTAPPATDWQKSSIHKYMPAIVSKENIHIGGKYLFQLSKSSEWSPDQIRQPISMVMLEQGLLAFKAKAAKALQDPGLWQLIYHGRVPGRFDHVCRVAKPKISEAKRWFDQALADRKRAEELNVEWAKKLVGLGHGLTPSGDDFIGGAMIALHAIGKSDISYLLWSKLRSYVGASTSTISFAHLRAASDGMGSEGIHKAISTIATGDVNALEGLIEGISSIGHTSGWDIMSGSITVLDSWLDLNYQSSAKV